MTVPDKIDQVAQKSKIELLILLDCPFIGDYNGTSVVAIRPSVAELLRLKRGQSWNHCSEKNAFVVQ